MKRKLAIRADARFWLLSAVLIVVVTYASAYALLGYKWPLGTNVRYLINANTDQVPNESDAVRGAGNTWNQVNSSGLRLTYQGTSPQTNYDYNSSNIVYWDNEGDSGALATSYIWYSGNTILETDLVFNDYYAWSTSGGHYDVETVALHEFGHWVGLGHTSSGIMRASYGGIERQLDDDAKNGFYAMYGGGEEPDKPSIELDRLSLSFFGNQERTFSIRNKGADTLSYLISADRSWISVYPHNGSSGGEWDEIFVAVDTSRLNIGNYSGTVRVTSGNADNSPQNVRITLTVINDKPPSVSISSPKNNAVISKRVTVSVTAKDDVGIKKVEFYVDNKLKSTDTNAPFRWRWDTSKESSGSHTLKAKAYDTSDQTDVDSIRVKVDQPPTIFIVSPSQGDHLSGHVTVKTSVSDDYGVRKVEFFVNDSMKRTDTKKPYTYDWDTSSYINRSHTLKAVVIDSIGQKAQKKISVIRIPHAPVNFSGVKQNNSSTLLEDYINALSWSANDRNRDIEKYQLFEEQGERWVLLIELEGTVFSYLHRSVHKDQVYSYMLRAVDVANREGEAVYLDIE
jgi:hypothetical protein